MGTGGFTTLCEPPDIYVVGTFTLILKLTLANRLGPWGAL